MYEQLVKSMREVVSTALEHGTIPAGLTVSMLKRAADALEDLDKTNWVDVNEKMPEAYTDVLVALERGEVAVDYVDYADGKWGFSDVSHWMPLPKHPQKENANTDKRLQKFLDDLSKIKQMEKHARR